MREDRKRAAVEALGLPRDVILGDVLLHFTGPYEVVAENFRSLLIYTDTYVKIKAAGCMVVFKGLHLEIETYTEDALKIKGQIRSVEFDDLLSERRVEGEYQCSLFLKDFYRLRGCARGKGVRLRICERRGLPFFLQRNRKRWYAAAGLSSFFLLLYIMSLFIWDIHFQGNHHYTADTLVRYLDTQDVRYGMKKKKINCEELEAGMREAFPQITWVSARVSGTRLVIQIKENKIIQAKTTVKEDPCDLVSDVTGTITYIMVRQGIPKVKKGEEIQQGQVLVSGRVPVIGDDEQEISAFYVQSQGEILAETVETYEKELPLTRDVRYPTGRKRYGLRLIAGPFSFSFLMPECLIPELGKNGNKENWDYTADMIQLKLFSNFYLPLFVGKIAGEYMRKAIQKQNWNRQLQKQIGNLLKN